MSTNSLRCILRARSKYRDLPQSERAAFVLVVCVLIVVRLLLRLIPFRKAYDAVESISRFFSRRRLGSPSRVGAPAIARFVNAVADRLPISTLCLPRALTAHVLLSAYGHSSQLRIGVAHAEGGAIRAHAWVESDGAIVMGDLPDLRSFQPLPVIGSKHR